MPYSISQQVLTILLDVVIEFNLKIRFVTFFSLFAYSGCHFFLVRSRLYLLPPLLLKSRPRY
jgi:hypothetical protein